MPKKKTAKPKKPRTSLEIPAELSQKRLVAAIQTLIGATGALNRLREQLADTSVHPAPLATAEDRMQIRKLSKVVAGLEKMAARQQEERARLLQWRLREEIVEAYHLFGRAVVGRGRLAALPLGPMGDGFFQPPDDAQAEVKVKWRIKRALFSYILLSGAEVEETIEAEYEAVSKLSFFNDHKGIVEAATRAAAKLLGRFANPKDKTFGKDAHGSGINTIIRNAHYRVHAEAPLDGETGYFFGAGRSVEKHVFGTVWSSVAHLLTPAPPTAPADNEKYVGRQLQDIWDEQGDSPRPSSLEDMAKGDVWSDAE